LNKRGLGEQGVEFGAAPVLGVEEMLHGSSDPWIGAVVGTVAERGENEKTQR
jgi:hypothetical protein